MPLDDSMLSTFHADLDRSSHLLNLVKDFKSFAAAPFPQRGHDNADDWDTAGKLHSSAARIRTDLPILSGSMLLYVCGRFEFLVQELISAIGDELAASVPDYESLPQVVRSELTSRTLDIAKNPHRFGHTKLSAEQLLVTLSRSFQPHITGDPVLISSEVLTLTESNMSSRMLTDIFKRVNIPAIWPEIGKQAHMKVHLGKNADGACTNEATGQLDRMMKARNGIAHPTSTTTFPDPDQVLANIEYLRVLSTTLVDLSKIPRLDT